MAFREVTMLEVKDVIRQWLGGAPKKQIAARLSCDPKTVRRYIDAAQRLGLRPGGELELTDELVGRVLEIARPRRGRPRGDAWDLCVEHRGFIEAKLGQRVRLSKVARLLKRQGVAIPYSTLNRFAKVELDFGRRAPTVPVADGEPGKEVQVDTGWVLALTPDITGKRRRVRAWIFTPSVSRHRFVYPCFKETTQTAIDACEAAWKFYGGVFHVFIPDNTKAIVNKADPLEPEINRTFLEYSQARGFVIDPTRSRRPKDKPRVERAVRDVRDDCFGGEVISTVPQARERAVTWSRDEYGMRRHSTTGRMPREHFEMDELPHLLPAPAPHDFYDIPLWCTPKVAPDQFAAVAKGLYTLPRHLRGHRLHARADTQTVRFYNKHWELLKTHPRVGPGEKSIDASDFPEEQSVYARRDVGYLERQARQHGDTIGDFAQALLEGPLPWTRMRRVRALLGLVKKYGPERVEPQCRVALAAEMLNVKRLRRMIEAAARPQPKPIAKVIPIARYLREPSQYALPLGTTSGNNKEKQDD